MPQNVENVVITWKVYRTVLKHTSDVLIIQAGDPYTVKGWGTKTAYNTYMEE